MKWKPVTFTASIPQVVRGYGSDARLCKAKRFVFLLIDDSYMSLIPMEHIALLRL